MHYSQFVLASIISRRLSSPLEMMSLFGCSRYETLLIASRVARNTTRVLQSKLDLDQYLQKAEIISKCLLLLFRKTNTIAEDEIPSTRTLLFVSI